MDLTIIIFLVVFLTVLLILGVFTAAGRLLFCSSFCSIFGSINAPLKTGPKPRNLIPLDDGWKFTNIQERSQDVHQIVGPFGFLQRRLETI